MMTKKIQTTRNDLSKMKCVKDKQWNIHVQEKRSNIYRRNNLTSCLIDVKGETS